MHIQDFHSKLTSMNEEGHLFEALRSLSQVESPQAVFGEVGPMSEWTVWPPMDAHASMASSAAV